MGSLFCKRQPQEEKPTLVFPYPNTTNAKLTLDEATPHQPQEAVVFEKQRKGSTRPNQQQPQGSRQVRQSIRPHRQILRPRQFLPLGHHI